MAKKTYYDGNIVGDWLVPFADDPETMAMIGLQEHNTSRQFEYNSREAEKARDYQTMMSNTAHQREVADLKAAGLNPILSAGSGGAASYTTSSASSAADNSAAGALASMQNSRINSAATVKAAEISARMMEKTAKISSDTALKQARLNYLASLNANSASRYAADRGYAGTVYSTDYSRNGSFYGSLGSFLNREGRGTSAIEYARQWFKKHYRH